MRRKASRRSLHRSADPLALLLPLGLATAEEGGELGDLFKELLRGGVDDDRAACRAAQPTRRQSRRRRPTTSACRSAAPRCSCPSRRW